ncbi:MAG TPA: hypothetical protein VGL56_11800 [Fimbriimonadaceae bacterium]|jgi:hypothetical protein
MDEFNRFFRENSQWLWVIAFLGVVYGIRLIRILTTHQQKMAQILSQNQSQQGSLNAPDLESMRRDLEVLKATVNQQTVLLDSIANQQRELLQAVRTPQLPEQKVSL